MAFLTFCGKANTLWLTQDSRTPLTNSVFFTTVDCDFQIEANYVKHLFK